MKNKKLHFKKLVRPGQSKVLAKWIRDYRKPYYMTTSALWVYYRKLYFKKRRIYDRSKRARKHPYSDTAWAWGPLGVGLAKLIVKDWNEENIEGIRVD